MRLERAAALTLLVGCSLPPAASEATVTTTRRPECIAFERVQLAAEFTCEGASFGDHDGDRSSDVVAGP